ncbi:yrdC domain-containing protein, mitochondrial-like isoform X2 [Varroa jacobsoni]|uniref:Threonylcarbamoyl-AMP synthase n=1 Tax=Varroa destructor TaxID=109461 RepID=A0A7M7J397_VARDE|nr:yrdC domain-containing protein, mitochondrial-like isoform X2 [Varroa destructor]XP_022690369.1 yrdC domain-containing protein, mitochondrial-like isoform X2 [Varroa jacobsoni]
MILSVLGPLARSYRSTLEVKTGCLKKTFLATIFAMTRPIAVGHVTRDAQSIDLARTVLRSEGVLAVPTDTVYGIAALAQSSTAIRKLYAIKQRDIHKPVAICVANVDEVYKWAQVTISRQLLEALLPGPVTLIFTRTHLLNPELNPDTTSVGVRIPDSPYIKTLCEVVGCPLALTSANMSSAESTLSVEEFSDLWPQLDLVVDAGPLCQLGSPQAKQRKGSTVVDLTAEGFFRVVRPAV